MVVVIMVSTQVLLFQRQVVDEKLMELSKEEAALRL